MDYYLWLLCPEPVYSTLQSYNYQKPALDQYLTSIKYVYWNPIIDQPDNPELAPVVVDGLGHSATYRFKYQCKIGDCRRNVFMIVKHAHFI
jgi:hypothetical protein